MIIDYRGFHHGPKCFSGVWILSFILARTKGGSEIRAWGRGRRGGHETLLELLEACNIALVKLATSARRGAVTRERRHAVLEGRKQGTRLNRFRWSDSRRVGE